jgi:anhydro-N-acetylmuramic acid kinase
MLNKNLQKLTEIATKDTRLGIGLMSGTSLDGLDIALCHLKGTGMQTQIELLQFVTVPYTTAFKDEVKEVFSKKLVDLEKLTLLNAYIGAYHAQLILAALEKWGMKSYEIDFIASHGQTIYHAPKRLHKSPCYDNATFQIGDGDHIAVKTGIITISDFRQKHIAAGGEGAPLALYGDIVMGSKPGEDRILLNIGGIANLTYLPGDSNGANILCTDIGPGNTLIDAACKEYFDVDYDEDGQIAYSGRVNEHLLTALRLHPFFSEHGPKTTGPELFNLTYVAEAQRQSATEGIKPADLIATLAALTAKAIGQFIRANFGDRGISIFVSGGGARNPFVLDLLQKELPILNIDNTSALGINADAKEALLFALLGNEAVAGEPLVIGSNPVVLMGKFSFPF